MSQLKFYSRKKKREYPESRLQKVIASHLMMSGAFFFSIPNEAQRSPMMAAHLKAMGMLPGVADLCVIIQGRAHFMEVKSPDGVQSAAQRDFQASCVIQNIPYALVRDIGSALNALSAWGVRAGRVAA